MSNKLMLNKGKESKLLIDRNPYVNCSYYKI